MAVYCSVSPTFLIGICVWLLYNVYAFFFSIKLFPKIVLEFFFMILAV